MIDFEQMTCDMRDRHLLGQELSLALSLTYLSSWMILTLTLHLTLKHLMTYLKTLTCLKVLKYLRIYLKTLTCLKYLKNLKCWKTLTC